MPSDAAAADKLEEERRLVEEAKRGNLDAMRPIFQEYARPLYGTVALPRLGDPATAEDVVRDTFVTAIEKLDSFQWTGRSIYGWLRQIAINKVYDVHRRSKRSLELARAVSSEAPSETPAERRPDAVLIAAEEQRINRGRIDAALAAITPRYREAITLRLLEELSREECAERMDVSVGTFDVVFFRAVRAFRKQFGSRS